MRFGKRINDEIDVSLCSCLYLYFVFDRDFLTVHACDGNHGHDCGCVFSFCLQVISFFYVIQVNDFSYASHLDFDEIREDFYFYFSFSFFTLYFFLCNYSSHLCVCLCLNGHLHNHFCHIWPSYNHLVHT